jgi:hypothetical protein
MYTDSDSQLDLSFRRLEFQTSGFRIDVGQWTEVRTKMVLVAAKAADVDVKMEAGISQSIIGFGQSPWKPGPKRRSSTLFEVWRTDYQVPLVICLFLHISTPDQRDHHDVPRYTGAMMRFFGRYHEGGEVRSALVVILQSLPSNYTGCSIGGLAP